VWRNHEQIFHFVKQGDYFVRELSEHTNRWRNSVWPVGPEPMSVPEKVEDLPEHYAAYPPKLVRSIILRWSPPGGVVLDPFGGTGTTAGVAQTCDRVGLSFDLSADYCRLAEHRLAHQFAQIGLPL
jgi:DNA modification methylase